jgi:DNA-binding LacI/PurR family transcriptional regulator
MPERAGGDPAVADKKLTIKDVARLLDVSTATVSNAFNRPDQLSEQLRQRILGECRRMGYAGPSAAARNLRTGRSGIVGVVLAESLRYSFVDPVASQFLAGVSEVLDQRHCNMLLFSVLEMDASSKHRLQESMVDGYLVYGFSGKGRTYQRLLAQPKRVVAVDLKLGDYTSVNVDNYSGARRSAEHALAHAPEHIAILGLKLLATDRVCRVRDNELYDEGSSVAVSRLNGYLDAIRASGRELSAERIWNVPENSHSLAYQAAREALLSAPRPTLLLCASDAIAIAALRAALQLGIRVPEMLHIVGFDGIPEASILHPTLTTVSQQSAEKGRLAARILLGEIEDRDVLLPTELVIGESCPAR